MNGARVVGEFVAIIVGVITMLESHFDIELDEDDLVPEKLSTVNGLAGIVESKR